MKIVVQSLADIFPKASLKYLNPKLVSLFAKKSSFTTSEKPFCSSNHRDRAEHIFEKNHRPLTIALINCQWQNVRANK
jgi:hypothetical protein